MKRIGVFVDVSNIYRCIGRKFEGRKLDYNKYLDYVRDLGDVSQIIAYGAQMGNEADGFIRCLKKIGYRTRFKAIMQNRQKPDWNVGLVIDIVGMVDRLDMVIIGSSDSALEPAVAWLMRCGVDVVILACGIGGNLRERAMQSIEIPESLLEA